MWMLDIKSISKKQKKSIEKLANQKLNSDLLIKTGKRFALRDEWCGVTKIKDNILKYLFDNMAPKWKLLSC